jgi:hypothetical protein
MRPLTIIGALVVAAGLFILINGASFTKDKTVLKAGPLEANVKQQESVPPWVGGAALVVGVGLVVAGLRKT